MACVSIKPETRRIPLLPHFVGGKPASNVPSTPGITLHRTQLKKQVPDKDGTTDSDAGLTAHKKSQSHECATGVFVIRTTERLEISAVLVDQVLTHRCGLTVNLTPNVAQTLCSLAAFFRVDDRDITPLLLA